MPTLSNDEYNQGYQIVGSDVVDPKANGGKGVVIRSDSTDAAPTQSGIANTLPSGDANANPQSAGNIFDYQTATRLALNEASASRKKAQVADVSPFTAGLPNSALTDVLNSINQGANLDATGTYQSFLTSQTQAQTIALQKQQMSLDMIKSMATDGSLGDLPDGALTAMSKASGLDANQLLSWRNSVKTDKELGRKKTQADIDQINANSSATNPWGIYGSGSGTSVPGLGSGTQGAFIMPTGPGTAAALGNVSGIKQNGKFTNYSATGGPTASFTDTVNDLMNKQKGNTKTGLTGNSSLLDLIKTWTGNSNGAYAANVASDLGITLNTPIGQLDPKQLAASIALHETGYIGSGIMLPGNPSLGNGQNYNTASIGVSRGNNTGAPAGAPGTGTPADQVNASGVINTPEGKIDLSDPKTQSVVNNPTLNNIFSKMKTTTIAGNNYINTDKVSDPNEAKAVSMWAYGNGVQPLSGTEVQGVQQINTALRDIANLKNTIDKANVSPGNWFTRLVHGPSNVLQKTLQSNNALSAYNTQLNQVITDLQAGGTIQGERIGTTLLSSVKDTLPDLATDTTGAAQAKINSWIALMMNKEASVFSTTNPQSLVKVSDPQGQSGKIPVSNLQNALNNGYRLIQ